MLADVYEKIPDLQDGAVLFSYIPEPAYCKSRITTE